MKTAIVGYIVVAVVCLAGVYARQNYWPDKPAWVMALPLVLFLIPLRMHFSRRMVKLTLRSDRLSWESGMLGKTTRTMDLSKVQDVRVQQSFGQRLLGIGSLTIQTAGSGEGGSITMEAMDQPQTVADLILDRSRHAEVDRHAPGSNSGTPGLDSTNR
ncbi:MAG: PH domain-containing protein [Bryobacteraceae bacterium]